METLDDSQKDSNGDATNKDTTDKPVNTTDESKMETIKLNDDKDAEKAAEAEQDRQSRSFLESVRGYKCSIGKLMFDICFKSSKEFYEVKSICMHKSSCMC